MTARGHTLVELMIATTVLALFFAVLAPTGAQLRRSERVAAAYVEDLEQCRRAVARLEDDLRQARSVDSSDDVLRIRLPDQVVDYRLTDGALTRAAGGRAAVVARRIGELHAVQTGRLVTLRVALQARAASPGRPGAVHSTVYLRNGGQR